MGPRATAFCLQSPTLYICCPNPQSYLHLASMLYLSNGLKDNVVVFMRAIHIQTDHVNQALRLLFRDELIWDE